MFRRPHVCITDPTAKAWWRDYQSVIKEGNPLGISFVEYVTQRVIAAAMPTYAEAKDAPWYTAPCGHQHPWGASCSEMAVAT